MLDLVFIAIGVATFVGLALYARSLGKVWAAMFILITGLVVALGLAVYLVVTLLAPERF